MRSQTLNFPDYIIHLTKHSQLLRADIKKKFTRIFKINKELNKYKGLARRDMSKTCNISSERQIIRAHQIESYEMSVEFTNPAYNGLVVNRHFIYTGEKSISTIVSGHVKDMIEAFHLDQLRADKKPEVLNRYVGIELEFCAPIAEMDLLKKFLKKDYNKKIQIKSDGSLRPKNREAAYEMAILAKENEYKAILKDVLIVLAGVKAAVDDRRCGLHVHLDMRKRDKDLVYNNLVSCQSSLSRLIDPSRVNGEFCKWVRTKKFPTQFTGDRVERYRTINAASYYRHRTLEIRMHEGCLDYSIISNWIELLLKIANYKQKIKHNVQSVPALKRKFNIKKQMADYLTDRMCYWQVNGDRDSRDLLRSLDAIRSNSSSGLREYVRNRTVPSSPGPGPEYRISTSPYTGDSRTSTISNTGFNIDLSEALATPTELFTDEFLDNEGADDDVQDSSNSGN